MMAAGGGVEQSKTKDKRPPVVFVCGKCGYREEAPPGTIAIMGCDGCGGWVE